MVQENTPKRVNAEDLRRTGDSKGGLGGIGRKLSGGFYMWVAVAIVAAAVCYLMNGWMGVPKATFQKWQDQVNGSIVGLQNDTKPLKDTAATVTNAINGIPNQVSSQVTKQVGDALGSYNTRLSAVENSVKTQADNTNRNVSDLQKVDAQRQADITALKSAIDKLSAINDKQSAQLVADEKLISSQGVAIAALEKKLTTSTTTSTSSSGTSSSTSGVLTVNLNGNPFTGTSVLTFPVTAAGASTGIQQLSFTIGNSSATPANNVQLSLLMAVTDANGVPVGLSNMAFTITSSGLIMPWVEQGTGVAYYRGWTNTGLTGFLGSVGSLSVSPGNTVYTLNISATNNGTAIQAGFMAYPAVKVIGYTQ